MASYGEKRRAAPATPRDWKSCCSPCVRLCLTLGLCWGVPSVSSFSSAHGHSVPDTGYQQSSPGLEFKMKPVASCLALLRTELFLLHHQYFPNSVLLSLALSFTLVGPVVGVKFKPEHNSPCGAPPPAPVCLCPCDTGSYRSFWVTVSTSLPASLSASFRFVTLEEGTVVSHLTSLALME